MLTALAMDSLGTIFEDYRPAERLKWLHSERTSYPRPKRVRRASFNTDFSVLLVTVFTQVMPVEDADMKDYSDELGVALQNYYYAVASPRSDNRYVRQVRGDTDTGIAIPTGMVLGMYAAAVFSDRGFLYSLVDATCRTIGVSGRDRDCLMLYAFLSYQLANEGYFGYQCLKELMAHKVVPPFLYSSFKDLTANHTDLGYLSKPFEENLRDGLSYTEASLMEAVYYMCRVDSSFVRDSLPSGPKDQLSSVFMSGSAKLADIGFAYGGLCTLSEQNYSLVTKPLREGVFFRKHIEEFFQYV